MSKGYLRSGTAVNGGTFAVIYINSIDTIEGMDEVEGCNVNEIVAGSMAYDQAQNVAVYDGEHWHYEE